MPVSIYSKTFSVIFFSKKIVMNFFFPSDVMLLVLSQELVTSFFSDAMLLSI
jgi:hypothetical protein